MQTRFKLNKPIRDLTDTEIVLYQKLVSMGKLTEWLLHDEQKEIEDLYIKSLNDMSFSTIFATFCRKAGKTFTAMAIAMQRCISSPNFRVAFIAPTREQLWLYIKDVYEELMILFPEEMKPKKIGNMFEFPNGSYIVILGSDYKDGNALRGPKYDLVIVDEAAFITLDLENFMKSIVEPYVHNTKGKILVISTPPVTTAHKYYKLAMIAHNEGRHIIRTVYDVTEYTKDPKSIPALIKKYGGEDNIQFKREYLCEFVTDPNARIVPEFEEALHPRTLNDLPSRPSHYQPYEFIDWGYKHNTAIIFGYMDFLLQKFVVEDEIWVRSSSTGEIANLIKLKEQELWGDYLKKNRNIKIKRIGDNNLQLCADLTRDYKMPVIPVKKSSLQAMVADLRTKINTHYIISPKAKHTRHQLKNGIWNEQRTKFDEGAISDSNIGDGLDDMLGHSDNIAALMYGNRFINWRENPFPDGKLGPNEFSLYGDAVYKQGGKAKDHVYKKRIEHK